MMVKDRTVCFQTSSKVCNCLEKLAEQEKQSVSSVVESIIYSHLRDNKILGCLFQSRRRSERTKVGLPAFVGDPRWQREEFVAANIIDLSIGGIRFSVPKGSRLEMQNSSETSEFSAIFTLPNTLWPIHVKFQPQRVFESAEEVHVGAALVNPDFYACTALQKHLICPTPAKMFPSQPEDSGNRSQPSWDLSRINQV